MTRTTKNDMNTNKPTTEPNYTSKPAPAIGNAHRVAGATRLKLLVAVASVAAVWFSYQAASEAIALHRLLDRMNEAMSETLIVHAPAESGANISETKARVAGL